MPDVRLTGDFQGHKAGLATLTDAELQEAYDSRVVGKVYREPVPTLHATRPRKTAVKTSSSRKRATKKSAAPTPAAE